MHEHVGLAGGEPRESLDDDRQVAEALPAQTELGAAEALRRVAGLLTGAEAALDESLDRVAHRRTSTITASPRR